MSRYKCCAGFMPCSGRFGEVHCPELCLGTEVCSALELRVCACIQTQHHFELNKRDGKLPPAVLGVPQVQQMSRTDEKNPPQTGYY
ncbi:hypothetical protein Prudu_006733 [Prunus dulcis]|uniref:Uncharacterized protein n=1 Tax=Prunus dulcis TaxID=3755 RepID=A0A4Y1R0E8_PRUDU|nr:hypothetical protein Prudu_006733 [Prunus dulcis]